MFSLANCITIIQDISVVGNIIQDWLKEFFDSKNIFYRIPSNSQEFPDYFLNRDSDTEDLLEVKCFTGSPNFDVANFSSYARSITEKAYRLDSDYLIFKYKKNNVNEIVIENVWLKKVWEICGDSKRAAVNLQWKQNQKYNIRPIRWYSNKATYKPFQTRIAFVNAINKVLNTDVHYKKDWKQQVIQSYLKHTGKIL